MVETTQYRATARAIERAYSQHGTPVRVERVDVLPGFVSYALQPAVGIRVSQVMSLEPDVGLALHDSSLVIRRNGSLVAQCARIPPATVRADTLMPRMPDARFVALLGIGEHGELLTYRLTSPETCHALVCGMTGSGKTVLARTILASLAARHGPTEIGIAMIDPKRITSDDFARSIAGHLVAPVAHETHEAIDLLRRIVSVMERRTSPEPRLLVYIDETADLCSQDERVLQLVQRIVQRGREPGVHALLATQKPLSRAIGSLTTANLPLRLVGHVASASEASTAAGLPGTGAERLSGRGDFLAVASGTSIRFQAALPPTIEPARASRARELPAAADPIAPAPAPTAARDPIDGAPPAPVDSLVTRIADYLREFPDASLNEISRQCAGKPYAGNSHCARIKAAVEQARTTTTGATTTGEKPAVEAVSAIRG